MYPRQTVTTPYGDLSVALTSGTHAHVGTEDGARITYRGRDYYVSAHFYVSEETGEWGIREGADYSPAYVTRDYEKIGPYKAPTIYKAIVAECFAALLSVVEDDSLLVQAERDDLTRTAERAKDTLDETREAFEEAQHVYNEAMNAVDAHKASHPALV